MKREFGPGGEMALADWLLERPQSVQDAAKITSPYIYHRLKTTAQKCYVHSFVENCGENGEAWPRIIVIPIYSDAAKRAGFVVANREIIEAIDPVDLEPWD